MYSAFFAPLIFLLFHFLKVRFTKFFVRGFSSAKMSSVFLNIAWHAFPQPPSLPTPGIRVNVLASSTASASYASASGVPRRNWLPRPSPATLAELPWAFFSVTKKNMCVDLRLMFKDYFEHSGELTMPRHNTVNLDGTPERESTWNLQSNILLFLNPASIFNYHFRRLPAPRFKKFNHCVLFLPIAYFWLNCMCVMYRLCISLQQTPLRCANVFYIF